MVAGYDDGTLVVYSPRNPNAPNATLAVNPYAHGPRRPLRAMRWAAAASADGGGARPALFVVGGTAREQDPDGLVVLKGEGLKERAMVAPPDGTVLGFGLAGGAELLPNGAPALASTVVVLTSAADIEPITSPSALISVSFTKDLFRCRSAWSCCRRVNDSASRMASPSSI